MIKRLFILILMLWATTLFSDGDVVLNQNYKAIDTTFVWQITLVFFVLFLTALFFALALRSKNRKLKQAEQQISDLSERLKLAFDVGRDGLWDWNLIDDTLYFSPRWKEMLGYRDDELESSFEAWESRVHPDDLEEALKNIELCIKEKKKVSENKHRLQHKDGHWIWIYDRGQVQYDNNGTAIRMIGTHTDLTTEIDLSDKLSHLNETLETRVKEQVEELERRYAFIVQQARLASMGEMINNIAHQWRQPLNRVNANVAVIISILESDNIDHSMMLSEAELIEKNTKYMSETIEDFAYYFHPEKEAAQFSLEEIIQSVLGLMNARLDNIDINIVSSNPVEVYSFAKEYRQVLLIILNNAVDNFESKVIDSPKIDIVIKKEEEKAYLSICDNGGGIEEKDIGRIFDPYYTTKFAEEGTGLGLYVAKMLIESSMQGKLNATNKNSGACFEIIIPPSTRIEINE